MYSYFVFLTFIDGSFFSLNVCTARDPEKLPNWLGEFWEVVDKRLKELHRPETMKDAYKFRIIRDPAHDDFSGKRQKGSFKLSGEFPGRAVYGDFQL